MPTEEPQSIVIAGASGEVGRQLVRLASTCVDWRHAARKRPDRSTGGAGEAAGMEEAGAGMLTVPVWVLA